MALSAGTRLGPYEILEPLGAGGMGDVYRVRDPRLKREVALKVLPADLAADPERLERFQREAAMEKLEYLLSIPSQTTIWTLRLDPIWDVLRDHPRFKKLVGEDWRAEAAP
jgi:serine/threonine protein kinase